MDGIQQSFAVDGDALPDFHGQPDLAVLFELFNIFVKLRKKFVIDFFSSFHDVKAGKLYVLFTLYKSSSKKYFDSNNFELEIAFQQRLFKVSIEISDEQTTSMFSIVEFNLNSTINPPHKYLLLYFDLKQNRVQYQTIGSMTSLSICSAKDQKLMFQTTMFNLYNESCHKFCTLTNQLSDPDHQKSYDYESNKLICVIEKQLTDLPEHLLIRSPIAPTLTRRLTCLDNA